MKQYPATPAKLFLAAVCITLLVFCSAAVAQEKPVKIGVVTFLSGAAAAPFGVPAKNAADVVVEAMNAGKVPAPYTTRGIGGGTIELTYLDEAGGTSKQVTEYRNLVQRDVDLVIGYISSGDCLAIAPVAEELKKLTVLFDCGTPRIFEDASYKYVFRTGPMATMDNIALAMYVIQDKPNLKKIAGINQNYAWGQDSWNDFEASMKVLKPGVQVATVQWPQFLSGQYGAEISALLSSGADVVHSSFWGGDLEAFILQAAPRGLFNRSTVLLTGGDTAIQKLGSQIPDGTVIGARGPFDMFAPDTALNRWFRKAYQDKYGIPPNYPAYKMVQAILGVKSAYEKAKAGNKGKTPTQDQVIAAFEHLTFEGPGGKVEMATGKGHQAVQGTAYGTIKHEKGKTTVVNVRTYPADKVTPPDGVKSEAWIKAGFKKPS
jgi:branched-chain amino acid transport system substrate-binding protein